MDSFFAMHFASISARKPAQKSAQKEAEYSGMSV